MRSRLDSPDGRFRKGKELLARAGNDYDLLDLAIQYMDAALMQRLRGFYPSLNVGPYELFNQLQRDHIVDATGRSLIAWAHSTRNKVAHPENHSLTRSNVEKYAAVVQDVLNKTQRRSQTGPKPKQRTSKQASTKSQKQNKRSTATSSAQPHLATPPPTEVHAVEIPPKMKTDQEVLEELLLQSFPPEP